MTAWELRSARRDACLSKNPDGLGGMSEGLSCSFVVVFVAAAVVEVAATEGLYFFAAGLQQMALMLFIV